MPQIRRDGIMVLLQTFTDQLKRTSHHNSEEDLEAARETQIKDPPSFQRLPNKSDEGKLSIIFPTFSLAGLVAHSLANLNFISQN